MSNETTNKNFLSQISYFIKKKIKLFIFLGCFLLISLITLFFFQNQAEKNNIIIAEQYIYASTLEKQKKINESKAVLESIINKDHPFYSPMALYFIIDKNFEKDTSKVIYFFDKILKNSSIDEEKLNLITIKKAIYLINLDNEEQIVKTLNPIINSNSGWRNIAINLIAEYFLSKNQNVKAEEYLQLLKNKTKK
jgi:predicted negative regulator of RcsB-dependent stress response